MAASKISVEGRRAVAEWIGKTPDSVPPPSVRLRVFERYGGVCHVARRKIRAGEPWDVDHVIALADWQGDGHGNRESNLAPALKDKHVEKTAAENRERARIRKKKAKAHGIKSGSKRSLSPPPGFRYDWSRGRYVREERS